MSVLDLRLLAVSPDDRERRDRLEQDLSELAAGGVSAFMLREKSLGDDEFVDLGIRLRSRCDELGIGFILNERTHLAEPIGANVVHLTWRSESAAAARARLGAEVVLGRSLHAEDEFEVAIADGLGYAIFGPIFATPSKEGLVDPQGLDRLRRVSGEHSLPVVAIGGIVPERAGEIMATGAGGIAAIRAFFGADPRGAAERFREAMAR